MNKEEVRKPNHGDMTTSRPDKRIKAAGDRGDSDLFFLSFLETDAWMKSFLKTF